MNFWKVTTLLLLNLLALATGAWAQTVPPLPNGPTAVPNPEAAAPGLPPAAGVVTEPVGRNLRAGVDAVAAGDLPAAEIWFRQAAAATTDPGQRRFAEELATRVNQLWQQRQQRWSGSTPLPLNTPGGIVLPTPAYQLQLPSDAPKREDARTPFVLTTTVAGLAVYGWAVPMALGVESTRAAVGLYMLTAGMSFLAPYVMTSKQATTWGQANLSYWGASRGLELGVLISNVAFGADGGLGLSGGEDQSRAFAASLALGSVAGLSAGRWAAGRLALTPGDARLWGLGGDIGMLWGFGMGHILELDGDTDSRDSRSRGMGSAGLLGTAAGVALGAYIANRRDHLWGDGEAMRMGAVLGAFCGLAVIGLRDDFDKTTTATLMAGSAVGLIAADYLVTEKDFSPGRALLLDLATVAGGLAGAGLIFLATETKEPRAFLTAAALGGLAGWGLAYVSLAEDGAGTVSDRQAAGLSVGVAPQFFREKDGSWRKGVGLMGAF